MQVLVCMLLCSCTLPGRLCQVEGLPRLRYCNDIFLFSSQSCGQELCAGNFASGKDPCDTSITLPFPCRSTWLRWRPRSALS